MSLRKSTNSRLLNARYITTEVNKCNAWAKMRRNYALLDESVFSDKYASYTQQSVIYTSILGQISDGNVAYKKYGIPNRVRCFICL